MGLDLSSINLLDLLNGKSELYCILIILALLTRSALKIMKQAFPYFEKFLAHQQEKLVYQKEQIEKEIEAISLQKETNEILKEINFKMNSLSTKEDIFSIKEYIALNTTNRSKRNGITKDAMNV